MKSLAKVNPDVLLSGLYPSVDSYALPFWADGRNVIDRNNALQPVFGHSALFAKPDNLPVTGMDTLIRGGKRTVVFGDRKNLYLWQEGDGSATNVTRAAGLYTGTDKDLWSILGYGEAVIATNGVDVPQYLAPGAADFVNLNTVGDYPPAGRAKMVWQNGPFVIFLNLDNGQENVQWSDEDSVAVWTPATGNLAGDFPVRDINSEIIAVTDLATGVGIFGRDQIHAMFFQGAPLVFSQAHAVSGAGALSKHSVVTVGRTVYGMGPRGIFLTDGVEYKYIDEPAIHRYIYADLNEDRPDLCLAWHALNEEQVYFCWGGRGATTQNRCASYNYRKSTWWLHEIYRSSAIGSTVFKNPLTATAFGDVFLQNVEGAQTTGEASPMWLDDQYTIFTGFGEGGFGGGGFGGTWTESNYEPDLDNPTGSATVIYVNGDGVRFNLGVSLDTSRCYLETKDIDGDVVDFYKALQGVLLAFNSIENSPNLTFSIKHRNSLEEPLQTVGPFSPRQDHPLTNVRPPIARYYRIRIEDSGITSLWRLSRIELFGSLAGQGRWT